MNQSLHFQHPGYAWAFLAVLAMLGLIVLYWQWKARLMKMLGDLPLVRQMMPGFSWRRQIAKAAIYLLALSLLVAGLLNLQRPVQEARAGINGLDVMFVVDVSQSMLATDVAPSRLEHAKLFVRRLVDTLQGSRVGMVAFAGQAFLQLPLTTDLSAARLFLSSVGTASVPVQGTDISQALALAAESMSATERKFKAMILITDGEEHDTRALDQAEALKSQGIMLLTVGVGTPNGATVTGANGETLYDENNNPVVSKLNETMLTELARITYGKFLLLEDIANAMQSTRAELATMDQKPVVDSSLVNYKSYSHALMTIALLLLLLELWLGEKIAARRTESPATLGPGTKALVMLLICLVSVPVFGQGVKGELRQGNRAYQEGRLGDAEKHYQSVLSKDSAHTGANFHLGNIAFKRKEYAGALQQYNKVLDLGQDAAAVAGAWNNKGLAYVQQENLPKAIEAFKQAVRTNPEDGEIRDNLNMALKQWQDQMQQQKQQPKESPDKSPDKNKFSKKQADDRLQALQQEEKRIREQMNKDRQTGKVPGSKEW